MSLAKLTLTPSFSVQRIGAKLYALALLDVVTVACIAAAAISFAGLADHLSNDIRTRVEKELPDLAAIELKLERHRRLVESAPVELERDRIASLRARTETLEREIAVHAASSAGASKFIDASLWQLGEKARNVLKLADNFAQAAAIEALEGYEATARSLQSGIADVRTAAIATVHADTERLYSGGQRLKSLMIIGIVVALLLSGPFSLFVIRGIVLRLKRMTRTMLRLANNHTSVAVMGTEDRDELGDMARALTVFKANARALLTTQARLETMNSRFDFAISNMARALSMYDADERLIVCNSLYRELYRLPDHLTRPGTPYADLVAYRLEAGTARASEISELPTKNLGSETGSATVIQELMDGRLIQVSIQGLAGGGWVALHEDVTEEYRRQEANALIARRDTVTGIANRYSFGESLEAALAMPDHGFAIHMIDLDRFKEVNDTHGHAAGDRLLIAVAKRLEHAVGTDDVVARLGGDEFAVLQYGVRDNEAAEILGRCLVAELERPFDDEGHLVTIGASIGIAVNHAGQTAEQLLRCADLALYEAKIGRGRCVAFDQSLADEAAAKQSMEADLAAAIRERQLSLVYQPILDVATGVVTTMEALARWEHPVHGTVAPAVFIPMAEATGLIAGLGAFVLEEAVREAVNWPEARMLAVNVSALQLADETFPAHVARVLAETGFSAHRLELELTETALLDSGPATRRTLQAIKSMGVRLALDDFGTGYSSLSYLSYIPFDRIKIDRSFIRDLDGRAEAAAIVRAVTSLARSLRMTTVAEGVETAEHLTRIIQAGCDAVQGYLIGRPIPADAVEAAVCRAEFAARSARAA